MTTITAKELRDNLDSIVQRVRAGERIRVTYRSQPAFTLEPEVAPERRAPGSPDAMKAFLASAAEHRQAIPAGMFDPNKSIKELYHDMLDEDPKYKPPYHR